jgi:hypothetical protein
MYFHHFLFVVMYFSLYLITNLFIHDFVKFYLDKVKKINVKKNKSRKKKIKKINIEETTC